MPEILLAPSMDESPHTENINGSIYHYIRVCVHWYRHKALNSRYSEIIIGYYQGVVLASE
jgi:hypothetical protein